ncbi:polyribonucleotide nucleotidyltransferase [Desulfonatronovibrio hydrogenovorans]|uniref:polyribonucleotide nucleotidyltransferase n=1 Tax=Desulfonatronovibrio hydrogenovorans TaxID=53245 RepID=UPI00048DD06F|nr:polyribonucleotide nucleotidyltransferase [Desulfonatronovibrio hydrogenovorans]
MENKFETIKVNASAGDCEITFETGKMANQADGSVVVQSGDTIVLVTAVTQPMQNDPGYFPLTVNYQEMSYASGRIPGGYFKREIGRPSDRETLTSRLIDRPIRPLFPGEFRQEVQVIATVLSADPQNDPDILAISGASAALHISKIPFSGPIAGARIGYIDGEFVINPSEKLLEQSDLNLVVAATRDGVVMVEGFTDFLPEKLIAEAINWGQKQIMPIIEAQEKLREVCGKEKILVEPKPDNDPVLEKMVSDLAADDLSRVLFIPSKMERKEAKREVMSRVQESLAQNLTEEPENLVKALKILEELEKNIVREKILRTKTRIDGRDLTTVRPLTMEIGMLPRTHGSAIFARGETKSLCVTTLGSSSDEQRIETLAGDSSKRFMLHYNFPPYCVGETKFLRGPSRREIGHGMLAERALTPVLPQAEDFPFTIRIVSEVLESNGSSSMATVCGGTLCLMDAGVPISEPVAGIAMGLIKEGEEYLVLTDILGDEDHLGDMDFKIAGTYEGVTAVQMDIKIPGIPMEVMYKALEQASAAKKTILDSMNQVIDKPRSELSKYAPKTEVVYVDTDKIKDVIGPSGKNIKAITAETGSSIDIEDSGKITVFSPTQEILEKTKEMILFFNQKAELGKDYEGEVKRILDFGAVVEILPGVDGLVHISQLDTKRVEKISDVVKIGDTIKVKVIEIGDRGKVRLSRMAVIMEENGEKFDLESAAFKPGPRGRGGDSRKPRGGGRNR